MIRGNVAVVRHGATAPSTQSGAVLLELSPSRMRDSGWDQLPPDVRFAGEALQKMRAPPWIVGVFAETGTCSSPPKICLLKPRQARRHGAGGLFKTVWQRTLRRNI